VLDLTIHRACICQIRAPQNKSQTWRKIQWRPHLPNNCERQVRQHHKEKETEKCIWQLHGNAMCPRRASVTREKQLILDHSHISPQLRNLSRRHHSCTDNIYQCDGKATWPMACSSRAWLLHHVFTRQRIRVLVIWTPSIVENSRS